MQSFEFTERQREARSLIAAHTHTMLFGGSRSGKTFLAIYALIVRALKTPASRHVVFRLRFNAVKNSVLADTFPKVLRLCFPSARVNVNRSDFYAEFENGAQIWFAGLDNKERTEKVLGMEFATIYLNESSQILWPSVVIAYTRLAQNCMQSDGVPLALRMLYDCNPPSKSHWSYKLFVQHVDPDTGAPLRDVHKYVALQMNPDSNAANLPAEYLETLRNLPPAARQRFYEGAYKDANPHALFPEASIEQHRVDEGDTLPDFVRVVVGVDPSGADDDNNEGNDAIGIYAAALGVDGVVYLLKDHTVKAGPATWGRAAVAAYHEHSADVMVGEQNFGGAMVKYVLQTVDKSTRYKIVTASRGKVQRAEPFSPLFCDGRVRFVGRQPEVEEELAGFSTGGYVGAKSPNRADALIWCLAELFPSIVGDTPKQRKLTQHAAAPLPSANFW